MSTVHPSGAPGFWSLRRVADALRSQAPGLVPSDDRPIARVWTDTRSVKSGDLFVALKGENFDAHDYLKDAVAGGAIAVVVSRPVANLGVPVIEVRDTLAALGALGQYRRRAWNGPVVAVAGSNGKTSTKELIRAALGARLEVHYTTGNLNNLIGVPLTLLAIPDGAEVAVVEMGTNQPGEVAALRAIVEPTVAVITSVGEEHLEGLGDVAGVLREELCVADGVAVLVAPSAQPEIGRGARGRAKRVVEAGLESGDLKATDWAVLPDGTGRLTVDGVSVAVPLRGVHNLRNAMLALAVARELGIPIDAAAQGIAAMTPPPMRVTLGADRTGDADQRRVQRESAVDAGGDRSARPCRRRPPARGDSRDDAGAGRLGGPVARGAGARGAGEPDRARRGRWGDGSGPGGAGAGATRASRPATTRRLSGARSRRGSLRMRLFS